MSMKAVVLHEYGPPKNLKWEEFEDPKPGEGEVLVRVQAASVNPVDWKMRSGAAKERFPVQFPAILGRDLAGIVRELGPRVEGFKEGDRVFALAWHTYAELAVVKASELALVPASDGETPTLEIATAASVPLVAVTGDQLMREGAGAQKDQTILLTGALGSVGRIAMFAAKEIGAKVIAGVRKKQIAEAIKLGAVAAIDLSDEDEIAKLGIVDAVADTIGGELATKLIAKVKPGGNYGSVVGPPSNAALHPTIKVNAFMAHPDAKTYVHYGEAIRYGKLTLPIDRVLPMEDAAEAHTLGEKGGVAKIVLTA
jgi:NADPH:quinone reductase-like Zn-dependent oxidoreductase